MESSSNDYDTIIIGGGHNGLVSATYLARAGCKVLLLERRDHVGGGAVTEELWPGHHFSTCAHLLHRMPPRIFNDFHFREHGVDVISREAPVFLRNDGTYSSLPSHESSRNWAHPANVSSSELEQRKAYEGFKAQVMELFKPYRLGPMPDRETFLKNLNTDEQKVFQRAEQSGVLQLQDAFFTDARTRAPYEVDIMSYGPNPAPLCFGTTSLSLDYPEEGEPEKGFVRGGMGKISEALEKEARQAGVTIQTGAECRKIVVEDGKAMGVMLADNTYIPAERILSNLDPKRTFLDLLDSQCLDPELRRQLESIGINASCMKFFAVLSELPEWKDWDGDSSYPPSGAVSLNSTREDIRNAYVDVASGQLPRTPILSFNIPSYKDRSLATGENQTASVWIFPVAYQLQGQSWDDCREEVLESVIDAITEKAPNFRDSIREAKLRTPEDLVRENAMTDGNIWHVPHTANHLFWNRPLPALRNYECPIENLYLCGSGQHPGGEVTGIPGHNAAKLILEKI